MNKLSHWNNTFLAALVITGVIAVGAILSGYQGCGLIIDGRNP